MFSEALSRLAVDCDKINKGPILPRDKYFLEYSPEGQLYVSRETVDNFYLLTCDRFVD